MATVRILDQGDRPGLEAFLAPHADASIFLLANSREADLVDRGERLQGTYFGAFEGERLVGVAAHYWNSYLIFQAPGPGIEALVAAARAAAVRPILGLIGTADQVGRARELLGVRDDAVQMDSREGLYALALADLRPPRALAEGRVAGRRLEPRDLELAVAWRIAYSREALKAPDAPALRDKSRADMTRALTDRQTWILEAGGRPVAMASFNAWLPEVVQLGGVWTPPEERGRGYARAVCAVALRDAAAAGVPRGVLFTGDENPAAIRAYRSLGFARIGDYRICLLKGPAGS